MLKQKNKGFTLIELLVVVAIIAILSTIVVVSINAARAKGKDSGAISQLNQARNQAEIYYTKTGSYNGLCDLTPLSEELGIYEYILAAVEVIGFDPAEQYVKTEKIDDSSFNVYLSLYQQQGEYYGRCHVSTKPLSPRWAAQVPLLKKGDNNVQQFYCVDSTGEGVITTHDLGNQQDSQVSEKKYLECIPPTEE
jgi:prepilin-type N-terminal cleavage/methylation domain-containing protein